jgi:hypothetical protein
MVRAAPALLAFTAFLADLAGAHAFAAIVLLAAIPAGFALFVSCYGEAVECGAGLRRVVVAGSGLFLLLLSAAVRSPALVGGVPRIAITAVALAPLPCLYAAVRVVRAPPAVPAVASSEERDEVAEAA